jgi:hypothetical protein
MFRSGQGNSRETKDKLTRSKRKKQKNWVPSSPFIIKIGQENLSRPNSTTYISNMKYKNEK